MDAHQKQQCGENISFARHQEATGMKDIQPFPLSDEKAGAWLVMPTKVEP